MRLGPGRVRRYRTLHFQVIHAADDAAYERRHLGLEVYLAGEADFEEDADVTSWTEFYGRRGSCRPGPPRPRMVQRRTALRET